MALKAGRVGVNPNYVDKEGRPLYDNAYLKELLRKEGIITLFTKEGNPISIDNAVAGRVYDLVVNMSPKQAGTGTPSPTNVREITGYDGLTITVNGDDITISFEDVAYGGTLDPTTGLLTITHALVTYDGSEDEEWEDYSSGSAAAYAMTGTLPYDAKFLPSQTGVLTANYLESITAADTWGAYDYFITQSTAMTGAKFVVGLKDISTTVAALKTYLSTHNLVVRYTLATQVTAHITPVRVTLVTGSNTLSSDAGTTMDLKYLGTLVPGGANGRSLNRSLNLNREVIDGEERKEIKEEIKEEVKEVPVEEPVTTKSTKKSTKSTK